MGGQNNWHQNSTIDWLSGMSDKRYQHHLNILVSQYHVSGRLHNIWYTGSLDIQYNLKKHILQNHERYMFLIRLKVALPRQYSTTETGCGHTMVYAHYLIFSHACIS